MNNKSLPNTIQKNITITEYTYYKMGGIARYFALPKNLLEIQEILNFCRQEKVPCSLLGSGSNCVYADGYFDGLILSLEKLNSWHWESNEYLFVEAGVTNTEVAEICASVNRAGASWMYRMPGQIGGTVRMNARCYGGEISQIAEEIITLNQYGELVTYKTKDIFHGYKKTLLMTSPHVVVAVRLHFPLIAPADELIQHMHECEADRHSKHHFYLPSCGSTFKNNYDVGKPSGKIFDELGLKGKRFGDAAVSEFHANFIWNCGQAKTVDMLNLSAYMRCEAKRVLQAELELEVQPVGVFSQELFEECGMEKLGPSHSSLSNDECLNESRGSKWVGLFYFPSKNEHKNNSHSFPYTIFSAPFIDYTQTPFLGVPHIYVNLIQLNSINEARKKPNQPFLRWETQCLASDIKKLFSLQLSSEFAGKFVDNLWNFSVSEVFFANSQIPSQYLEFEVTPQKNWIALKFSDVRKLHKKNERPNIQLFSDCNLPKQDLKEFSFGMIFTYENLEYAISKSNSILTQCALSLGKGRYLLAPYWTFDTSENPDFHQPHKFWKIELN